MVAEKDKLLQLRDQAKTYMEHEVEKLHKEIAHQSQHITGLEKERDRYLYNEELQ